MTLRIIGMIRRLIERGLDDATIVEVLAELSPQVQTPPAPSTRVPRATIAVAKPAPGKPSTPTFHKPDTTRTAYRIALRGTVKTWAKQLDGLRVVGSQRAVADFIIRNGGTADSREIRANVLTYALRPDGSNKAVESAIHAMKKRTPAIIVGEAKPPAPYNGPGIELDD